MNKINHQLEQFFTIVALVFFTRVLDFESSFIPAEGLRSVTVSVNQNPIAPFLSLTQHSIFLLVASLLLIRWKQTFATLIRGRVIWVLLLLVAISFVWSNNPNVSFRGIFALMESCAFGLYFASNYNLQQQLRLLTWALGITSLITLIYTITLPSYGIENGIHQGAWRGPFIQKNILARILILSSLTHISIKTKHSWHSFCVFCGLTLSLGLTVLSQSKTALMVLVLLLILNFIYRSFRLQDLLAIPLVVALLSIFTAAIAILVSKAEVILSGMGKDLTLSGRTIIWSSLIEQIKLRPWFGYGYMGFWSSEEAKATMTKLFGTTYAPSHSHNGYLELITSFGLIGLVLFSLTFIGLTRRAIISMRWNHTREGLWPLLFLSFLLVYNFSEPTLIEHNSIFWIVYLSLALTRFVKFNQSQSEYLTLINTKPRPV